MLKWIPFAMVRIAAIFIVGILFGIYAPEFITNRTVLWLFLIFIAGYFTCYFLFRNESSLNLFSGVIGLVVIFLSGYLNLKNHIIQSNENHLSHFHVRIDYYLGQVVGGPEKRNRANRIELEIEKIKSGSTWRLVTGKCLLYIAHDTVSSPLQYGVRLLVKGPLPEVLPPGNPGEFDFKKFLSLRNITHQQFVGPNQVLLIERKEQSNFLSYSQSVRRWASSKIEKFVSGQRERAITEALVLGVTEGLDNDLLDAYAATGAMHILSVSGLHVGIIYAIISFLLIPFRTFAWSRWLVALLSLSCLWAYAFVTGLSPSVLRAVTMFSFIALARPFGRQTNIYNTLAASAFLLLIYDPFLILSVGFQLSYLAVIGIVYLYRPLYNLWEPGNWFFDKVWQATCVSVAAQLATFALGLFYFHQFPVYFLLSNLIVIPLSSLVLVIGIFLLAVSSLSSVGLVVGHILEFLISMLNGSVFFVENLPGSLISGVDISAVQCLLQMAAMAAICMLLQFKNFKFVIFALIFVGSMTLSEWSKFFNMINRTQFIVYQIPGHSAMEWISRGQSKLFADSGLLKSPGLIRYHIHPNQLMSGVLRIGTGDSTELRSFPGFVLIRKNGLSVCRIDKSLSGIPRNIVVDYLIIGKDAVKSIEEIRDKVQFKRLILDGSNSKVFLSRILKEAATKNIAVHSILSHGAFVVNL